MSTLGKQRHAYGNRTAGAEHLSEAPQIPAAAPVPSHPSKWAALLDPPLAPVPAWGEMWFETGLGMPNAQLLVPVVDPTPLTNWRK